MIGTIFGPQRPPAPADGSHIADALLPTSDRAHVRPDDSRWITRTVALVAVALFAISGSHILPALLTSGAGRVQIPPATLAGFLLNIALIILAWRKSEGYRQASVQRDAAESKAYALAYYDELTGLHNRRHFRELIANLCAERVSPSALILIDLDDFKKINDLYGHAVGDRVLIVTAERLKRSCPGRANCIRLGGDEFAVFLQGTAAEKRKVGELAQELVEELSRPIRIDKTVAAIGVSIGISRLARQCTDQEWLLRRADIAMYEAKRLGRNRCVSFDPSFEAKLQQRNALEAELRQGIENGEFVPHFQPIIDLATGGLTGFEVLARWQHPTKGLIEPPDFIELAESIGTISELSFQVMQEALMEARDWPSKYRIAVNISPVQFNDPFLAARVLRTLSATGFPPERLEIEVREQSLLQNHEMALSVLASLKNIGISVTVDDFGIGYASFTRLRSLPFDRIKLDRSYMESLLDEAQCDALIHAVSALGRGLKVPITAEGVESLAIQAKLGELGCSDAQGWLYGKALSAHEVAIAYLDSFAPAPTFAGSHDAEGTTSRALSAGQ